MELVILGFLMIKSLSQYEIKKALTRNLSPYYSASLGSIQSALKRLIKKELILCKMGLDKGRKKNIYSLTDKGRAEFFNLMQRDFVSSKFDTDMATRLFFLGLLDNESKLFLVKKMLVTVEEKLRAFDQEKEDAEKKHLDPAYKEIQKFQLKSLELAYRQYQTAKEFFEEQILELEDI